MKYADFKFSVEGLTGEQAGYLLDIIVLFVESVGGEFGGGLHFVEEDENEKTQQTTE